MVSMIAFASNPYSYSAPPLHFDEKVDGRPDRRRPSPCSQARRQRQRQRQRSQSPAKRGQPPAEPPLFLSPNPISVRSSASLASSLSSTSTTSSLELPRLPRSTKPSSSTAASLTSSLTARPKETVQDVLRSTAIPIRRKRKPRTSQRIPDGDHVADFSRLLRDDMRGSTPASLSNSPANPVLDGLFGNIDELVEGQMIIGSDGLDASILSAQSMSPDSMPSLPSADDYSSADNISLTASTIRSASERRIKQLVTSEDCVAYHPLMGDDDEDGQDVDKDGVLAMELTMPSLRKRSTPGKTDKARSFKSSLTASLRAIKLAAQSVSNYGAATSATPDSFGSAASVFDFQPSLTDDRRPPPLEEPPSPALRRYLNPSTTSFPESPAQLNFWIEPRTPAPVSEDSLGQGQDPCRRPKSKTKTKRKKSKTEAEASDGSKSPPLVPMTTCIPSQIRTAHASSPPVWLAADGTPSSKHTSPVWEAPEAGLRHCEPRENRDFLRIYVCETQMRRVKKLRADIEGKARMWLPPIDRERRPTRPATERLSMWLPHDDDDDDHDHNHNPHNDDDDKTQ